MTGGFQVGMELCNCTDTGTDGASCVGFPDAASANVKGAYQQIIGATPAEANAIVIFVKNGKSHYYSLDLAIGGSGSEKIFAPDLLSPGATNDEVQFFYIPINIPAGNRLSGRAQSDTGGLGSINANVYLLAGGMFQAEGCAGVDAIGFVAASTRGATVTSGATGAKGSYAQLTAATLRDYIGLFGVVSNSLGNDSPNVVVDVAIGGSGSEKIILPNLAYRGDSWGIWRPSSIPFMPMQVPKGTRIAARMADDTTSGSNAFGLTMYGVYQ